jgi:hypothetical protein
MREHATEGLGVVVNDGIEKKRGESARELIPGGHLKIQEVLKSFKLE